MSHFERKQSRIKSEEKKTKEKKKGGYSVYGKWIWMDGKENMKNLCTAYCATFLFKHMYVPQISV